VLSGARALKWLITGGCGFIGTTLIRRLIGEGGHKIRVVDNLSVGAREDLAGVCQFVELKDTDSIAWAAGEGRADVQLVVADILDADTALAVAGDVEVIVHLAANTGVGPSVDNPRQDCVTNVIGTLNYLEAARLNGVKRFVFASSGAPAGEIEPPIHEEVVPHPVSPYGASKLAGEGYCSAYFRTFGIETVALRFGNVYGPGSGHKNSVVAKFIKRALNNEVLEIYGSGGQTRDFIFNEDLVNAILLAASKGDVGGEIFQIATGSETTVNEMVDLLSDLLRSKGKDVRTVSTAPRVGDVLRNYSDTTKAKDVLGWSINVNLVEGLGQTLDWFRGSLAHPTSSAQAKK